MPRLADHLLSDVRQGCRSDGEATALKGCVPLSGTLVYQSLGEVGRNLKRNYTSPSSSRGAKSQSSSWLLVSHDLPPATGEGCTLTHPDPAQTQSEQKSSQSRLPISFPLDLLYLLTRFAPSWGVA